MLHLKFPPHDFLASVKGNARPLLMEYASSGENVQQLPKTGVPEFALVGRSNVGKSSLLNFLAGQKQLARVSHTPGRTQMIHLFWAEKKQFVVADLPGYGFAKVAKEARSHWVQSMSDYFQHRKELVAVLMLVDCRREIEPEDKALSIWFQTLGLSVIGVQTKIDKINKSQRETVLKKQAKDLQLSSAQMVSTSASGGIGRESLILMMAGKLTALSEEQL